MTHKTQNAKKKVSSVSRWHHRGTFFSAHFNIQQTGGDSFFQPSLIRAPLLLSHFFHRVAAARPPALHTPARAPAPLSVKYMSGDIYSIYIYFFFSFPGFCTLLPSSWQLPLIHAVCIPRPALGGNMAASHYLQAYYNSRAHSNHLACRPPAINHSPGIMQQMNINHHHLPCIHTHIHTYIRGFGLSQYKGRCKGRGVAAG